MDSYPFKKGEPSLTKTYPQRVLFVSLFVIVAVVVLVVGAIVIYAFGGGWLSAFGLSLPTPWNAWAALVMSFALIAAVIRIIRAGFHK